MILVINQYVFVTLRLQNLKFGLLIEKNNIIVERTLYVCSNIGDKHNMMEQKCIDYLNIHSRLNIM